jgi:2'-5' RNA ligase
MHLTLKFLGDTEEKIIPESSRKLTTCLANIEPFEFVCGMTGCFPNIHKPRVLWLGITDGVRQVQAIARQVATALQDFGFQPEERAFCPHLTLGRVKNPRRAIPGLERFLKYEIIPTINPVENVIFYESNLTSGGAIYTRLAGFNLK